VIVADDAGVEFGEAILELCDVDDERHQIGSGETRADREVELAWCGWENLRVCASESAS
jgi:hypothetical protein